MIWGLVGLGVLLVAGLVIAGIAIGLVRTTRVEEAAQALRGEDIIKQANGANFFGQQSRGMGQVRGNGVLALTRTKLYFLMWLPKREFEIPLTAVTGVERPRSFLGKSKGIELLKVAFRNDKGESDAMAWVVPELDEWERAVRSAAGHERD